MSKLVIQVDRKIISSDYTVVWYWFDRKDENPEWRHGTDENFPATGLYKNGKLISTVHWNKNSVTLEMVESFLKCASDFQRIPGIIQIPETL